MVFPRRFENQATESILEDPGAARVDLDPELAFPLDEMGVGEPGPDSSSGYIRLALCGREGQAEAECLVQGETSRGWNVAMRFRQRKTVDALIPHRMLWTAAR